jgi:hypothetical protein
LTQAKTHTLFEEGFEFEQEVNLEKSEYSTDCIVLGFAGEEESIESSGLRPIKELLVLIIYSIQKTPNTPQQ